MGPAGLFPHLRCEGPLPPNPPSPGACQVVTLRTPGERGGLCTARELVFFLDQLVMEELPGCWEVKQSHAWNLPDSGPRASFPGTALSLFGSEGGLGDGGKREGASHLPAPLPLPGGICHQAPRLSPASVSPKRSRELDCPKKPRSGTGRLFKLSLAPKQL